MMKNNLEIKDFLNGVIAIKVNSNEQSRYLINLSKEDGFDVGESEDIFEVDTYRRYPYYFIEDNWQLQASDSIDNALYNCESVENFEDWFEGIR